MQLYYWRHNYFDSAISYYNRSLALNTELGNWNGIAGINSNLAFIYADQGKFEDSYAYFEKTLAVRKSNNERIGIISALVNESVVLNNLKHYKISLTKLEEALSLAQELNDEKQMRSVFGMLSETYQKMGNIEKSLYYYEYYKTFNEYITNKKVKKISSKLEKEQMQKNILKLEAEKKQLELEKKELLLHSTQKTIQNISKEQQILIDSLSKKEMSLLLTQQKLELNKTKNTLLNNKKRQQRIIIILSVIVIIILFALLIWIYSLWRIRNKNIAELNSKNKFIFNQKEEIETQRNHLMKINELLDQKNQETILSLNYAQRIQKATFMSKAEMQQIFKDSFLFFRPLHIVSGDFYYINQINEYQKIVVVGDCTGHGVPGAFLTILGINILDNITNDKHIHKPSEILLELDKKFHYNLNKRELDITDGMDVSVCFIDTEKNILEYAGAKNHLLIVNKNKPTLIKGSNESIGHTKTSDFENLSYKNHTINIEENSWLYMFSDGFVDQFNSEGKKFLRKNLVNLLTQNANKNGNQQHEIIQNSFDNWKKDTFQIDDVIVMGFCS